MPETAAAGKRPVGRPSRLSRAVIADAALRIGLDRATLKQIGAELGIDHSTLYRHVRDRDDLMSAAVDQALSGLTWQQQAAEGWRAYLVRVAEMVWTVYETNPGVAETIRSLETTPPSVIRAFVAMCEGLHAAGFSAAEAVLVVDSVMDMTLDSAVGWRRLTMPSSTGDTIAEAMRQSWYDSLEPGETPSPVGELMTEVITGSPRAWWLNKIELLLDGAAARYRAA